MAGEQTGRPETDAVFARLDELGLTQNDLAAALGIEADKVSKTKGGTRQFKGPELLRAREWLDGQRPSPAPTRIYPDQPPTIDASSDDGTVEIPQLDLSFSMGPGTTIDDYIEETVVKFDNGLLRSITRTPPHRLRLAKGVGESMFPTLLGGDVVMLDTTQRHLSLQDGIYSISLFGAVAIKRLRAIGPAKILVKSDNPNVDDQEVDAEDLIISGRVVWFAREL